MQKLTTRRSWSFAIGVIKGFGIVLAPPTVERIA